MSDVNIKAGKDIVAEELTVLRRSVNWTQCASCIDVERSIDAYPFIVQARNSEGELIGYVSAFSDEVLITIIGELLVHPIYQRRGIGTALLKKVARRYPGIPIQAYSLSDSLSFFTRQGYTSSEQIRQVVLDNKIPINEPVVTWATG